MIDDRKTLIILTPGFPANQEDTTCLPAQQSFVRAVNNFFPQLKIIILSFEYPFSKSEYFWFGNKTIAFAGKNRKKIFRLLLWRRVWKKLHEINREENIAGLLSFWCTETAVIGKAFAKRNRLKHYCWVCGQDARKGNKMVKLLNPQPQELIAMSDSLATEFFSNYKVFPLHVIPNGITPEIFAPNIPEKDIQLSGAGSLIALKRYDIFINVASEIIKILPSARGALCGKGMQEHHLKLQLKNTGLEDKIELTGEIPHYEILKIMQRTKIFLHTSSYEGFSGACLEALYAGAHVISFVNPMKQKIAHWHIVQTEKEMVAKSIELLNNPSTSFTPVLPFTMHNTAKEMINLFLP